MDTIISYLDNLFASLPQSEAVLKAKRELLASMEEKYRALKSEGKTENEAVGTVIAEFGNIDELISELGVRRPVNGVSLPLLKEDEVKRFLSTNRQAGLLIGLGVVLCIIGVAMLIIANQLAADGLIGGVITEGAASVLGLIVMLILIAIGVGFFVYSGLRMDRFKYLEKGFELPVSVKLDLQRDYDRNSASFTAAIVVGVGLCIVSPVPLFLTAVFEGFPSQYGVAMLLTIVSIAVFTFIRAGTIRDGYNRLLNLEDYSPEKVEENKVTGAVASVVFPLAALVYLYLGFFRGMWHPGWMIFPAVGILFGIFSAIYGIVKKEGK